MWLLTRFASHAKTKRALVCVVSLASWVKGYTTTAVSVRCGNSATYFQVQRKRVPGTRTRREILRYTHVKVKGWPHVHDLLALVPPNNAPLKKKSTAGIQALFQRRPAAPLPPPPPWFLKRTAVQEGAGVCIMFDAMPMAPGLSQYCIIDFESKSRRKKLKTIQLTCFAQRKGGSGGFWGISSFRSRQAHSNIQTATRVRSLHVLR